LYENMKHSIYLYCS